MTTTVLADTGPLYAAVDRDDQYHQRAQQELTRLASERVDVIICTPVLLEVYPLLSRRLGLPVAHTWVADVSSGAGFLNPGGEDYFQAVQRARAYDDQPLTLVDCVLAVISERLGIPVWSYDHHFDILRVTRWL